MFFVPSKRNALDSLLPVEDEALPRLEPIDLSFSIVLVVSRRAKGTVSDVINVRDLVSGHRQVSVGNR